MASLCTLFLGCMHTMCTLFFGCKHTFYRNWNLKIPPFSPSCTGSFQIPLSLIGLITLPTSLDRNSKVLFSVVLKGLKSQHSLHGVHKVCTGLPPNVPLPFFCSTKFAASIIICPLDLPHAGMRSLWPSLPETPSSAAASLKPRGECVCCPQELLHWKKLCSFWRLAVHVHCTWAAAAVLPVAAGVIIGPAGKPASETAIIPLCKHTPQRIQVAPSAAETYPFRARPLGLLWNCGDMTWRCQGPN
jgi:hypothetical protein